VDVDPYNVNTARSAYANLMHLSSGHVDLLRERFQAPKFSRQSNLQHREDSRWALLQIYSFLF